MINTFYTIPHVLKYNSENFSNEVALREKDFGIWKTQTWGDCYKEVKLLALALSKKGVKKNNIVGLLGSNRPRWVLGEIASQSLGAIAMGIYSDALENEIKYLINYSFCEVIFVEDEEQADKIISLGKSISSIKLIIYDDERGMNKYRDKRLISYNDLVLLGKNVNIKYPKKFDSILDSLLPEDIGLLCPTSGTTSNPKLAKISHLAILKHAERYLEVDPKNNDDEYVSVLPLPWIMEQMYAVAKWLISRMKINFVEEQETMMSDLREIGPSFILLAPRVWEQIAADVRAKIMESSFIKRNLYNLFIKLAANKINQRWRLILSEYFLFYWLRDRLGFSNLKSAATGGAALGPDTFKFFILMGIPLRQLYGQTELLGAYTIHKKNDVNFNSVGLPFKDVEINIDNPDQDGVGEILVNNKNMMSGYLKEKTSKLTSRKKNWFKTGDAGYIDSRGHLIVIDRLADLSFTASKIRFSPQYIENKLKFSTYIAEAALIGTGKKYISAIICIRYSVVSRWAERKKLSFTTYSDLSGRKEVELLVKNETEKVNQSLPKKQRIKKFVLLYKEFDADDGELTRTRKLRRRVIAKRYKKIISAIYNDNDGVNIDTRIVLQDGSYQRIKTNLNIVDVF